MVLCPPPASPQVHPRDCKHPRPHEGNKICPKGEVRESTLNKDDDEAQRGSETVSEEKGRAGQLTSGGPRFPRAGAASPPGRQRACAHPRPWTKPCLTCRVLPDSETKPPALSMVGSQAPSHLGLGLR